MPVQSVRPTPCSLAASRLTSVLFIVERGEQEKRSDRNPQLAARSHLQVASRFLKESLWHESVLAECNDFLQADGEITR